MPRFFNGWFTTAPDPAPPGGFTSLHGDAEAACSDGLAANLTDCTRNRRNRRPEEVSKSGVSNLEDLAFEIEWKEASFVFMFKSKTNP